MTLGECDDQLLELRQQDVRPQQLGHADTVQRTVRVLGPVEAVVDGQSRPLRPMARRLLAVLAVMSGRVVRTEQILCRL